MPSWLRLRRARRYNVSSKNSYVVCVHLLDNTLIEATLNAESTGQECLENIAQRIELNEVKISTLSNYKISLNRINIHHVDQIQSISSLLTLRGP